MHDGISKFKKGFNGVYMWGVHPDTYKPVLVPYCLRKIKGRITAYNLAESLFEMTGSYIIMKENTL